MQTESQQSLDNGAARAAIHHAGNLTITSQTPADFLAALTSVGGGLDIYAENAQLPALTSVGGTLYIQAKNTQLPALTSVGGWLAIRAENAQLPALTSVGGLSLPDTAQAHANLRLIAPLALAPDALEMSEVHQCDTAHCIAGWATTALPGGKALEAKHGWSVAGCALLGVEAAKFFYSDNEKARAFLQRFVAQGEPA